jgi:hypothetical protein
VTRVRAPLQVHAVAPADVKDGEFFKRHKIREGDGLLQRFLRTSAEHGAGQSQGSGAMQSYWYVCVSRPLNILAYQPIRNGRA